MHTCGFIAFSIKRKDNIPYPILLPLGSFVWVVKEVTLQTKKRKHDGLALYYYDVSCVHSTIKNEDIHVIPFREPRFGTCKFSPSPLDSLFEQHMNLKRWHAAVEHAAVQPEVVWFVIWAVEFERQSNWYHSKKLVSHHLSVEFANFVPWCL